MTSCIAFLCLIDVLSYDLVQVKSSGCCCQYSVPFHGSEDALLYGLHGFFPQFMPPWTFWWLCVFDDCNYFFTEGWSLSFLTMVFSECFSNSGSGIGSCEPLPVDAWSVTTRSGLIQPGTKSSVLNSNQGSHFPTPPLRILSSYPYFTSPSDRCQLKPGFFVCMSRVVSDPLLLSTLSHMQRGPGTVDAMGPYVGISWPGSSAMPGCREK